MSNTYYEGAIGRYSFIMNEDTNIEVWEENVLDLPYAYIPVKSGYIRNEKDFHFEISDWYMKHVG